MSKATGSGKTFGKLLKTVLNRPSHSKFKQFILNQDHFQKYLEDAQKEFKFTFTEESLDAFMTDWVEKAEQLAEQYGVNSDTMIDEMRAWADRQLYKFGLKAQNPEGFDNTEKMWEMLEGFEGFTKMNSHSIKTEDGKEHKGFKWYDPDNPVKVDGANKSDEFKQHERDLIKHKLAILDTEDQGVYNFKLMDYTKEFCVNAGAGMIEQFKHRANDFRRRLELIETSKKYRFEDSFLPLLVHHNKNEFGYRRMPNNNMWIEVALKFGNLFVSGVHLSKVYIDPSTKDEFGSPSFRFYDDIIPSTYTQKGVSVFVCGIEAERYNFFYHFILEESDIEDKKLKSRKAYSCPYCSMPLDKLQDKLFYCNMPKCIKLFQDDVKILYNLDDKRTQEQMKVFEMKVIWKAEDHIRQFATNLLDFLTNKRVQVICNTSKEEMAQRNLKRAKKGKAPLYPVNIIKVDGTLKEYVTFIKTQFRGNYKLARVETMVDGHFYRFKDKSHWTKMYSLIKKCKTDEEIEETLAKVKRRDPRTDDVLPDEEQYEWDSHYKIIKYWKLPYYRFKGQGNPRDRIDVIKTGVKK